MTTAKANEKRYLLMAICFLPPWSAGYHRKARLVPWAGQLGLLVRSVKPSDECEPSGRRSQASRQ